MTNIPTEAEWIKTCLDLGFRLTDTKALRQIYRKTHPAAVRIEQLEAALTTCRELREYDRKEIERLRAALDVGDQTVKNSGKKFFESY